MRALVMVIGLSLLVACSREGDGNVAYAAPPDAGLPSEGRIAAVPLGDVAGVAVTNLPATLTNPLEGNASAVQEGKSLFIKMNCAGCHGYDAGGGMGPSLVDHYWRYGGVPVSVYKSIFEGRPQGMPAWGQALPPQEIWKLVAYLESLGGTFPADQYHAALQGDLGSASGGGEREKVREPNRSAAH